MRPVTQPERYHLVAPLPALGGWRRMLALDRRGASAGPVVLSFAPPALLDDPRRLAALARDAEAGARVRHPNAVPLLGLETVEEQLALVEPYRAGTTLRALLDSSGRLPPELALRVATDTAAGLSAVHAVDPGDGQPLAHGALTAERILVGEDGGSLLQGLGAGGGRSPAEDVRALAAVLVEALSGDPPSTPPRPLDAPGVPAAVAAVLDRALGAVPGERFETAAGLAAALSAAQPPASPDAVAVYLSAAAPAPVPFVSPEAPEVSAELIAPGPDPLAGGGLVAAEASPPPDAAITFPAPVATGQRRRSGALILAGLALLGFGTGLLIAWLWPAVPVTQASRREPAPPITVRSGADASQGSPASEPTAQPPGPPTAPPAVAVPPSPPASAAIAAPAPRPPPAEAPKKVAAPSVLVTSAPPGEVLVDGKSAGHTPALVEVSSGEHEIRVRDRAQGVDVRRKVHVKAPATPVHFELVRGILDVAAPDDTEVRVDGKRIGTGNQHVELWEGWHEVEARRGTVRVHERFEISAGNTHQTYTVTPTP
ncbi:MAG TPA: PEGA domain-containing protein [Anaeromyxobacter sp.]|nr:PEGA domain-containing protein [Anaeromyxobacter sp.]